MSFKTTYQEYIERVKRLKVRESFVFEGKPLYSFLEPFIIGNNPFCSEKGFPQFVIPERVNKKTAKGRLVYTPFLINNSFFSMLNARAIKNLGIKINSGKTDLVFFSNSRFIDNNGSNIYFDRIIGELKKEGVIKIFFDTKNPLLIKKGYRSIYDYLSLKNLNKIKKMKKEISIFFDAKKGIMKQLFKEDYAKLEESFEFFLKILPLQIAAYIVLTEEMLSAHTPKICIAVSEAEFFTKGLIVNAKKNETKVFTLQYGEILKGENCDINPTNDIIPDIKFVEGTDAKETLVKYYDYPEDGVIVTGSPRYDYYSEYVNESDVRKELGFGKKDKILVFFDQSIPDLEYTKKICEMLSAVQKKVRILIKIHPFSPNPMIIKEYKKLEDKNKNISIIGNVNNRKILSISSIAVTCYSTVSLEAILTKTPLILINIDNQFPDYIPYAKEGSALKATSKAEFIKHVDALISYPEKIESLRKGQKKSIILHAYKNDGNAYKRISSKIKYYLKN